MKASTLSLAIAASERRRSRKLAALKRGNPGKAGPLPDDEKIAAVAEPIIRRLIAELPKPKNWYTTTDREILALARPVIAEHVSKIKVRDGDDGDDGDDGATIERTEIDVEGNLILHMTDGRELKPGRVVGPMPRHQIRDGMIRFQQTLMRWGQWIRLKSDTAVVMANSSSGGSSMSEYRVRQLIESAGGIGGSFENADFEYDGQNRLVRLVHDGDESRYDYGDGSDVATWYKGTALEGSDPADAVWKVVRELRSGGKPAQVQTMTASAWDDRAALPWP